MHKEDINNNYYTYRDIIHLTDSFKDGIISSEKYNDMLCNYYEKSNDKELIGKILMDLDIDLLFKKKVKHTFKVLSKKYIKKNRSKAYTYLVF